MNWVNWVADSATQLATTAATVASETVNEIIAEGKEQFSSGGKGKAAADMPRCLWEAPPTAATTTTSSGNNDDASSSSSSSSSSVSSIFTNPNPFWSANPMQWACLIKGIARDLNTFIISPTAAMEHDATKAFVRELLTRAAVASSAGDLVPSVSSGASIRKMVAEDEALAHLRFDLVPRWVREDDFWGNFAWRCRLLAMTASVDQAMEFVRLANTEHREIPQRHHHHHHHHDETGQEEGHHRGQEKEDDDSKKASSAFSSQQLQKRSVTSSPSPDGGAGKKSKSVEKEKEEGKSRSSSHSSSSADEDDATSPSSPEMTQEQIEQRLDDEQHLLASPVQSHLPKLFQQLLTLQAAGHRLAPYSDRLKVRGYGTKDDDDNNNQSDKQEQEHAASSSSSSSSASGPRPHDHQMQHHLWKELADSIHATAETETWRNNFVSRASTQLETVKSGVTMLEKLLSEVEELMTAAASPPEQADGGGGNKKKETETPSLELIQSVAESCKFHKSRVAALIGELQSSPSERVQGTALLDPDSGELAMRLQAANQKLADVLVRQAVAIRTLSDHFGSSNNSSSSSPINTRAQQQQQEQQSRQQDGGGSGSSSAPVGATLPSRSSAEDGTAVGGGSQSKSSPTANEFTAQMPWDDDDE